MNKMLCNNVMILFEIHFKNNIIAKKIFNKLIFYLIEIGLGRKMFWPPFLSMSSSVYFLLLIFVELYIAEKLKIYVKCSAGKILDWTLSTGSCISFPSFFVLC